MFTRKSKVQSPKSKVGDPTSTIGRKMARSTGLAPVADTIEGLKHRSGGDIFSAGLAPVESTIRRGQAPDVAERTCHRATLDFRLRTLDSANRRGVILLVVMVLLALMTLMGLTLVLVTAQGRLSALASSRNGLEAEHDVEELTYARTQVIAGSADPNSSFGAHGIIEDMYGQPQFFGQIMRNDTGVPSVVPLGETVAGATFLAGGNNGSLLQLLVTAGNINTTTGAGIGLAGVGLQSADQYVLPRNSGAFCGQVITMLTGPAQGQSARVVGYYYNAVVGAAVPVASMQVSSFGGVVPRPGDQFMINGQPFSGTGFGLNLALFSSGVGVWTAPTTPDVPLLSAVEAPSGQYYAYLPNHAQLTLSTFVPGMPGYWDPAGPGGANEPYDAPDFQNLMLAMHYYSPFLLPAGTGGVPAPVGVITPIPSLHRPELVAWFYNQALITATPAISMGKPAMRRKVILRPEPTDHYFVDTNGNGVWDAREPFHDVNGSGAYDGGDIYGDGTPAFIDLNGDGVWTPGEVDYSGNTFNPITGCWFIAANGGWQLDTGAGLDVDNDKDGTPDSIWVDGGLPAHTEVDGTLTKNLIAVLCIDLDGKANLNAHGTLAQLDQLRYDNYPFGDAAGFAGSSSLAPASTGTVSGPMAGTTGSAALYYDSLFQRNMPVGQGYGPADVNPLHLFVRSHSPANMNAAGVVIAPPLNTYTYSAGSVTYGSTSAMPNLATAQPLAYYATFLQGYDYQTILNGYNGYPPGGVTLPIMQVDGRYGESSRLTLPPGNGLGFSYAGVFPRASYNYLTPPLTYTQQILNGPRAGWSQWIDPYSTSLIGAGYWVNDPVALARFSDIRPGLLTPPNGSVGTVAAPGAIATPFFFDFLDSYMPGAIAPYPMTAHVPTGHGSPSDLHSRGILTTDIAGHPYYVGTLTFPWQVPGQPQAWQTTVNNWMTTMTDYAASEFGNAVQIVLNEGVDTQYEQDLTQGSGQGGQNTGNTANGFPDFASGDYKLSPSELEGILRTFEQGKGGSADSASLLQRLNNLETANALSTTPLYSLLANKSTSSATPPTSISPRNDIRLAVTGESWDLPVPNLALTPRQMQDVVQYVNYFDAVPGQLNNLVNPTATLNLNNIGLVDLARARIFADNYFPGGPAVNPLFPLLTSLVSASDLSLFGNVKNIQQYVPGVTAFPLAPPTYPVWPLLAPETVLGMRLDVNRALGNGQDDNGNGVVDEPLEVLWQDAAGRGEYLVYPFSQISVGGGPAGQVNAAAGLPNGTTQNDMLGILDLNNDGFYAVSPVSGFTSIDPQLSAQMATKVYLPTDPTYADMRARQLLAKHLYCLAMLLLDDRPYYNPLATGLYGAGEGSVQNIMAQIFSATGPTTGSTTNYYNLMSSGLPFPAITNTGTPYYNSNPPLPAFPSLANMGSGSREQAAYVIAQWAVNVVDFRDRDSIMTPFEFDLYPFRADDPSQPNVTWNVDDIIDPVGVSFGTATPQPGSLSDDNNLWRGLVWGCERPELLLTETVAFHDRGTNDTSSAQTINDSSQTPSSGPDTTTSNPTTLTPYDKDWDQSRRPRGSLVVELFNPNSYWDAPQADMQQPWQLADANLNIGRGVNLAQVAAGQPANNAAGPAASPVWRIVVAYSPWQTNESQCYVAPSGVATPIGGGGYSNSPASASQFIDQRVPILPPGAIHRVVYFTPFNPGFITGGAPTPTATVADTLLNNSFFADPNIISAAAPNVLLPPGQYALVGPANQNNPTAGAYNIYAGQNTGVGYPWTLQLATAVGAAPVAPQNSVAYLPSGSPYGAGYSPVTAMSTTIKPVVGVPIQTSWFTSSSGAALYVPHSAAGAATPVSTTLRMSVSEPEHGYPVWSGGAVTTATASGSIPTALQDDAPYSPNFPQHPFDSCQGNSAGGNYLQFGDFPNPYVAPTGTSGVATTLGYTVLYLQRLANPLQAWDQKMNPYITVDSMPVDLTAYTGEPGTPATGEPNTYYPAYKSSMVTNGNSVINALTTVPTNWTLSGGTNTTFDTRRRGYAPGGTTMLSSPPNVWTPLPTNGANVFTTNYGASTRMGTLATPMPASTTSSNGSSLGWINYEHSGGSYYSISSATNNPITKMAASGNPVPPYMYNGDPTTPIPWLAWNNRPYISQYELMLVPASSPSSQMQDFGMLGWNSSLTLNAFQPYTVAGVATPPGQSQVTTPTANTLPAAQFMQLLNFFNNEQSLTATDTTNVLPNLFRIFEFLQVPSRYTGTQDMLNPSQFAGDDAVSTAAGAATGFVSSPASHLFHPPFNWLPRYREPGKINLNTIFDPVVFQCLMDDYPGSLYATAADTNPVTGLADAMVFPRGLFHSMMQSRQGFYFDPIRSYQLGGTYMPLIPVIGPSFLVAGSGPSYTVNALGVPVPNSSAPPNPVSQFAFNTSLKPGVPGVNSDIPTYFANPFRPDGAAAFVPPTDVPNPGLGTWPWMNYLKLMHQWNYPGFTNNSVNATLLRSQDGATFNSSPIVVNELVSPPTSAPPTMLGPLAMLDDTASDPNNLGATYSSGNLTTYRHAGQNATFQYQMFNRLGNTTTNRSNVYAIWITLGKFVVQPVAPSPTNPDGYKLVEPYLDGQGNQVQTRGFYIFDRSIPMGFQRGQDINIEKGMLIERVLQMPQ